MTEATRIPCYSAAENTETLVAHYKFSKSKKIGNNIKVGKKQHKNVYASDFLTIDKNGNRENRLKMRRGAASSTWRARGRLCSSSVRFSELPELSASSRC